MRSIFNQKLCDSVLYERKHWFDWKCQKLSSMTVQTALLYVNTGSEHVFTQRDEYQEISLVSLILVTDSPDEQPVADWATDYHIREQGASAVHFPDAEWHRCIRLLLLTQNCELRLPQHFALAVVSGQTKQITATTHLTWQRYRLDANRHWTEASGRVLAVVLRLVGQAHQAALSKEKTNLYFSKFTVFTFHTHFNKRSFKFCLIYRSGLDLLIWFIID